MARCRHRRDLDGNIDTRCEADATHYLHAEDEGRIGLWCEGHAREIVTEYQQKLGWHWTMEVIEEEL